MPKFTTISPTHIEGKKPYAWGRFRDGGYVAIGWLHDTPVTGKSIREVKDLIAKDSRTIPEHYPNKAAALKAFTRFLSLRPGDCVAVNNANCGLFGVGVIISDYQFQEHKHDCGAASEREWYSHYMKVHWIDTTYTPRAALILPGETGWEPYGTVGKVYDEPPPYILRLLGLSGNTSASTNKPIAERPPFLEPIIRKVETLRAQQHHTERDHESLVEDFFVSLGYRPHEDIRFRQGRIDILLRTNGKAVVVVEVKRDWGLNPHNAEGAIRQAYGYALEQGIRRVMVTNGDTYILFDRLQGLSFADNRIGEFQLTSLRHQDLVLISRLYPSSLEDS